MEDSDQPHAELVFMGEAKVGKTCLIQKLLRYPNGVEWNEKYEATVEDSFIREFIAKDRLCRLRIIDTAGGYVFPAMHRLWLKRANAFVLVCARDNHDSLGRLKSIVEEIHEQADEFKSPLLVIAINKNDIPEEKWMLSDLEVEMVADELDIPFSSIVLTSARENTGIIQLLKQLWKQNEEAFDNMITFDNLTAYTENQIGRRASALPNLFGSSNTATATSSGKHNKDNHRLSISGIKLNPNLETEHNSRPATAITKMLGRLSLGGRRSTTHSTHKRHRLNNHKQAVINLECNPS